MTRVHRVRWVWGAVLGVVMLSGAAVLAESPRSGSKMVVSNGKQVSLEYTLKLEDKTVVESNVGREAMTYTQGAHEIVPGLEKALEGLAVGDKKRVEVQPADGYGNVDPKAIQEVKKSQIPENARKVGAVLEAKGQDGQSMFPRVTEVKSETVVLDFNHPLAGKTLIFEIKVLDIKAGAKNPS
ncbi:MAG TPA: peptidylprolyl isomerase [Nitrospiraceae bacterium]|nr:peptidylprolyl isomerase [Nitrospiraceae bacterium]